jgi:hypothetical protein
MSQPTDYIVTTDFSAQESAGTVGLNSVDTTKVDAEFDNIETTISQILTNLALIQADDGTPKDDWVDLPALADDVINWITTNGNGWYAVDTGSVNAIVVTLDPAPTAFVDGTFIFTKMKLTNTSVDVTLTNTALGAKAVVTDGSGTKPRIGGLLIDTIYGFQYNSTLDKYQIVASPAIIEASVAAAETAQTAAETAQTAAETAQTAAETAQTAAETAETNAETAQTAAETAETNAETAQTAAETAQTAAETAETNAETAQTAAETAETNAETAETNAETAETNAKLAAGLEFNFNSLTTDSDKDSGDFWLNNATPSSATVLYLDDNDANGVDVSTFTDTWDDVSNTVARGYIYIRDLADSGNVLIFSVSGGTTDATGYSKLAVSHILTFGAIADNAACSVQFSLSGADGTSETEGSLASATSPDLFATADRSTTHFTGTTTIVTFADAPSVGLWRKAIFDDVLILTNGSGITLQGGANITTAAGDYAFIYATAVDAFTALYFKADGTPVVGAGLTSFAGSLTRDVSLATGDISVTGVGFLPSAIIFFMGDNGSSAYKASWGFVDENLNQKVSYTIASPVGEITTSSTICIRYIVTGSDYMNGAVISFDADGFTITFTKVGSPTGTAAITYLALK